MSDSPQVTIQADRRVEILTLAVFGVAAAWFWHAAGEAQEPPAVVMIPHEHELVALDRAAARAAYQQQITHLFLVWMRDPTGQPERARRGVDQARRAFTAVIDQIDRRERALQIPMPPARPQ